MARAAPRSAGCRRWVEYDGKGEQMNDIPFDGFDACAKAVINGDLSDYKMLSKAGRLYTAIASNRADLLAEEGCSIVDAFVELGPVWAEAVLDRWRTK